MKKVAEAQTACVLGKQAPARPRDEVRPSTFTVHTPARQRFTKLLPTN